MGAKFRIYTVENVITEESASRGDYESSDPTPEYDADLREALEALMSDSWDHVDARGDGTIIAYPADYAQDMHTGAYSASEVIIKARRPEWADRLMDVYEAEKRRERERFEAYLARGRR